MPLSRLGLQPPLRFPEPVAGAIGFDDMHPVGQPVLQRAGLSRRALLSGLLDELLLRRELDEVVCRVKLHVLPASEFRLPSRPGTGMGVDGLGKFSPRQLAYLAHVLDGADDIQIADKWDVGLRSVQATALRVKAAAGSDDVEAIARDAAPAIEEARPWLPLEGRVMDEGRPRQVGLSPRQIDVIRGYAEGKKWAEIARELGMHPTTSAPA